jgi:nitrogen fixation protein NifX
MEFQVAVASLDGILINQHFGKNREFLIYRVQDNGEYGLVERRELKAPCGQGQHHEETLVRSAKELQDCSFVLVARIGPGAEKVLASHGIKAFEIYDRIDRAIDKLIKYLNGLTKH